MQEEDKALIDSCGMNIDALRFLLPSYEYRTGRPVTDQMRQYVDMKIRDIQASMVDWQEYLRKDQDAVFIFVPQRQKLPPP